MGWTKRPLLLVFTVVAAVLITVGLIFAISSGREECSGATVSWAAVARFDGVRYNGSQNIRGFKLGDEYARVQFQVAGNVCDPGYELEDGDVTSLSPGTPLYEVEGYGPRFLLASGDADVVFLWEAESIEGGSVADFLDIGGRVESISLFDASTGHRVGLIDDPQSVAALVDSVLASPAGFARPPGRGDEVYFVAFHMKDGLTFKRAYVPATGILAHRVQLPAQAQELLLEALRAAGVR